MEGLIKFLHKGLYKVIHLTPLEIILQLEGMKF